MGESVRRHPGVAAAAGALTLAPLAGANAVVGGRIEPFFSLIRPGAHTSAAEYALLAVVLLLLPLGAFVAARPLPSPRGGGMRPVHALNVAVAALLVGAFVTLSWGVGSELYRCDVLRVPNCD